MSTQGGDPVEPGVLSGDAATGGHASRRGPKGERRSHQPEGQLLVK
jgi:hypothetical protein